MNVLPQLRAEILGAVATAPRRRAPRPRLVAVALVILVAVAIVALRSTPRTEREAAPSPPTPDVRTTPPAAQLRTLAVLRRTPTSADDAARAALLKQRGTLRGIRAGYIRALPGGAILYTEHELSVGETALPDAICTYIPDPKAREGGGGCDTLTGIKHRTSWTSSGLTVHGLVPDGVATVIARFKDGTERRASVQDNAFTFQAPANKTGSDHVPEPVTQWTWLDMAGKPLP
jgi:hypothetical protein